jgi:hypothetical protein
MAPFPLLRGLVPFVVVAALLAAACGSTSGSPAPGGTSTPAVTASPTPSGDEVLQAFLAKFASEDVPLHVSFNANVEVQGQRIPFSGEVDAVGSDAAGTVTVPVQGQLTTVEMVLIKGNAYGRAPGGQWGRLQVQQTQPINPFPRLRSTGDLKYVGIAQRAGRPLHQLRTTRWIGEDPSRITGSGLEGAAIRDSRFDIFTESDGKPVEAALEFTMTGRSSGGPVELKGDVTYRFSRVGEKVTITPPPVP